MELKEYTNAEETKEFMCVVGTKLLSKETSKYIEVSYLFNGFRDNQSISVLFEEKIKNTFNEVKVINSTNLFLDVTEGSILNLPNYFHSETNDNLVLEVTEVHPMRNSIVVKEKLFSS